MRILKIMALPVLASLFGGCESPGSTSALKDVPGATFRDCFHCPEMVVIRKGRFLMGSPSDEKSRQDDEGPVHPVSIDHRFAIGTREVTFDNWQACVLNGGCTGYWPDDNGWGRGERPVINVSWRDVRAYVGWLSKRTGKRYRLPSEAEWEYAARAGTTGPFSFGTISPEKANYNAQLGYDGGPTGKVSVKTRPVGSYSANGFGLFDVHGNVEEWVEDCFYKYEGKARTAAPIVKTSCRTPMKRGGSWDIDPGFVRSADRSSGFPNNRSNTLGFRVARDID